MLGYRQIETGHISRIYEGHARKKDFGLSCSMPGLTHSPGGMKYGVKRRLQKLGFSSQNLKSKEAFFTRWGEITVGQIPEKISFNEVASHPWSKPSEYADSQSYCFFESSPSK